MRLIPVSATPAIEASAIYTGNLESGPIPMSDICAGGTRGKTLWIKKHVVAADEYSSVTITGCVDATDTGVPVVGYDGATALAFGTILATADKWYVAILGADYPYLYLVTLGGDNANTITLYIVD